MTPAQKELARHALGLPNRYRKSYRNRFYAGAMDHPEWVEMVKEGYALSELVRGSAKADYTFFCLTRRGAELALNKGEKLCDEDFPPRNSDKILALLDEGAS